MRYFIVHPDIIKSGLLHYSERPRFCIYHCKFCSNEGTHIKYSDLLSIRYHKKRLENELSCGNIYRIINEI